MTARKPPVMPSPPRLPWWGSVLLAAGIYCVLKYGVPLLHPASPGLEKLVGAAPVFAPFLTIPWLLLAAKQLYDTEQPKGKTTGADRDETPPEQ